MVPNEQPDRTPRSRRETTERVVGITAGERRTRRRSNVEMTACVRNRKGEDDMVVARNASRGGFEFLSSRSYVRGEAVKVAAPFLPGSTNIFVPARIVWQRASGTLHCHGVQYD